MTLLRFGRLGDGNYRWHGFAARKWFVGLMRRIGPVKDDPFRDVAHHQLIKHRAPWKIDQDWTIEVYASDGALVAKPSSMENAVALVEWAARETKEMDDFAEELERDPDSYFDKVTPPTRRQEKR